MKHSTNAKIAPVQLKEDNRFYAEAEIVFPDKFEHIELFIDTPVAKLTHLRYLISKPIRTEFRSQERENHRSRWRSRLWLELSKE
jgi:hypothetical protein